MEKAKLIAAAISSEWHILERLVACRSRGTEVGALLVKAASLQPGCRSSRGSRVFAVPPPVPPVLLSGSLLCPQESLLPPRAQDRPSAASLPCPEPLGS